MWISTKYMTMAIAATGVAVAAAGPASAQHRNSSNGAEYRNNGYAGAYGYGWPAATYDAPGYGLSSIYGYGGSYRAVSYGSGLENGQSPSAAAAAPVPERTRPIVRRRGPKRLE